MDELTKLEAQSDQLAAAIKSYIKHRRDVELSDQLRANSEANKELNKAKTVIHASMAKIKTLLGGPVELLQDLARQGFQKSSCAGSFGSWVHPDSFTWVIMTPTNNTLFRLEETSVSASEPPADLGAVREPVVRWSWLHATRSLFPLVGAVVGFRGLLHDLGVL
ncbi:anthrone oxygenase tpcL [Aspergillus thermomutatus]|uniref:Uncharacterized protein n=1 Tax=Aspergillus thermomutatus TaxID=41047 RepID=A0A397H9R1_ASPTH|nr:uncharacterized protein CDV56_104690 [Aspergillus thermomutatus]RHZ59792.1 hypothetical protein CDV56_104690 [Aspergillus thermomutatus]